MYSLPQSYNQTSKCKRCISSNAYDSVQTGFCNELTLEHIIPVCNGKLAGEDECFPVVPVIYNLFKVMLYLTVQLDHPKIIYNLEKSEYAVTSNELKNQFDIPIQLFLSCIGYQ